MIVIDTHALIWFVQGDQRLGKEARESIDQNVVGGGVRVPAITAWEIAQVERRGRGTFPGGGLPWMLTTLALPGFTLAALDPAIAIESVMMTWAHKDPADRMIVATARHLQAPLLTADRIILDHAVAGHLEAIDARR